METRAVLVKAEGAWGGGIPRPQSMSHVPWSHHQPEFVRVLKEHYGL
ncbi:hypothetical protein [Rufibacter sp. XAAS-G3-1]|nr:hypothetical protein [Rufibacter sp. XAAS-G3-1]